MKSCPTFGVSLPLQLVLLEEITDRESAKILVEVGDIAAKVGAGEALFQPDVNLVAEPAVNEKDRVPAHDGYSEPAGCRLR